MLSALCLGFAAGFVFFQTLAETMLPYRAAIAAAFAAALVAWIGYRIRRRLTAGPLDDIDAMTGHEFERFLSRLFSRLGFRVRLVGASGGDFGADLIIERDGISIAVQAKNYEAGHVGNDAVQQAIAGTTYYNCHAALVVTNSLFTKAAEEQAERCAHFPVTLWNRLDLETALRRPRDVRFRQVG